MNCESVQEMLIDSLGTLGKSSAELREHLAECPACTEVAQQQVRLGTAIHALRAASSMELQQAKGAVSRASNSERTLLAAFRLHHADLQTTSATVPASAPERSTAAETAPQLPNATASGSPAKLQPYATLPTSKTKQPKLWRWGSLAAGVLLGLGILLNITKESHLPNPPQVSYLPKPPKLPSFSSPAAAAVEARRPARSAAKKTAEYAESSEKNVDVSSADFAENTGTSEAPSQPGNPPLARAVDSAFLAGSSPADEFVALLPPTPGFLDDAPVVMRVRMPWTAAERLRSTSGAPVALAGPESAGAFVQADLLVGPDGIPRAIRFVQ